MLGIEALKSLFSNGQIPSQNSFWGLIDSFWHKSENIPMSKVQGLGEALAAKMPTVSLQEAFAEINRRLTSLEEGGGNGSVSGHIIFGGAVNGEALNTLPEPNIGKMYIYTIESGLSFQGMEFGECDLLVSCGQNWVKVITTHTTF
jgi:hypothetical protein